MHALEAGWYPCVGVGHRADGPWWQCGGGEHVVDGNSDVEAGGQGTHLEQAADIGIEGEVDPSCSSASTPFTHCRHRRYEEVVAGQGMRRGPVMGYSLT